jgi:MYXO-CTERM domain-containing protein
VDLSSLVLLATVTGYGDPVDGYPSHVERELLLWTNAARVAPDAFEDEYEAGYEPCSFDDFSEDEQTPKDPLYIDLDLTEVARVHSIDMKETPCFQHESCDGTDPFTRIGQYYKDSSYVGENIAEGSSDPRYSVMGMWMCSTQGHRANIMSGDWNEMGPGVDDEYMTQDFGQGNLAEGNPPVRTAIDVDGTVYADWGDAAAPAEIAAVLDGVETPLTLQWGVGERGIYGADVDLSSSCTPWYVYWKTAAGAEGTFPEDGSYQMGTCDADWVEGQAERGGLFGDVDEDDLDGAMLSDIKLVGCATAPGSASGIVAIALALATFRRRR